MKPHISVLNLCGRRHKMSLWGHACDPSCSSKHSELNVANAHSLRFLDAKGRQCITETQSSSYACLVAEFKFVLATFSSILTNAMFPHEVLQSTRSDCKFVSFSRYEGQPTSPINTIQHFCLCFRWVDSSRKLC